jgi:hypothetical protein
MTRAKKLKKAIRTRARKTGESYTSARRQVLQARTRRAVAPPAATVPPLTTAAAAARAVPSAAGRRVTSDRSVVEKTGHGLDHWFAVLDAFEARAKGHSDRAAHLSEAHGVPGWYCQMITVEYERARGHRVTNQAGTGDFQVSVSRVVPATAAEVAAALGDARRRGRWLRAVDATLGRAVKAAFKAPKAAEVKLKKPDYALTRFPWDRSAIEIHIYGKPGGKSSVIALNKKLAGSAEVEARRALWAQALDALKAELAR